MDGYTRGSRGEAEVSGSFLAMAPKSSPPPLPKPSTRPRRLPAAGSSIRTRCGGSVHASVARNAKPLEDDEVCYAGFMSTAGALVRNAVFSPTGLAPLTNQDCFIELGCGHGDVLLAAKESAPRCRCIGVEVDASRAKIARTNASAAATRAGPGVSPIKVICGNIDDCFEEGKNLHGGLVSRADAAPSLLADATVVFLFLSEWANLKLRPGLLRVLPIGARIVSRSFTMGEAWPVDAEVEPFSLYLVTAARKADAAL